MQTVFEKIQELGFTYDQKKCAQVGSKLSEKWIQMHGKNRPKRKRQEEPDGNIYTVNVYPRNFMILFGEEAIKQAFKKKRKRKRVEKVNVSYEPVAR